MKSSASYILLFLLLLAQIGRVSGQIRNLKSSELQLPVLPYPQAVNIRPAPVSLSPATRFESTPTESGLVTRLQQNWDKSFPSGQANKVNNVQLVLLTEKDSLIPGISSYLDSLGNEGYYMVLTPTEKLIAAKTETGLFYGIQSLKQLTRSNWDRELTIADWPAFRTRVIYDDISRGPISTVAYVKDQIRRLAELKINYLSFYIEHVVQPVSYPDFAPENGKLTIPDIRELSDFAAQYHMQLIGSFQSFGHFEKILSLPKYRSMGETPNLISPLDPNARQFLKSVIEELCDAFSAPWFNVNCDETFDLNKGKSKAYIDSIGPDRFYADHIRFLYDVVKGKGKKMMIWGDIALQHESILDMLPDDIVYLTWEYGDQASYDRWITPFTRRNLEYMVCPGILNSYRMFPDMAIARENIRGFLDAGHSRNTSGAFTTIWDDGGISLFANDWYGVYIAAEKSWNLSAANYTSFDNRYNQVAYGKPGDNYAKALARFSELRQLSLTYNLNDQLWLQRFLPGRNEKMILNNSSTARAIEILTSAGKLLEPLSGVLRHKEDIQSLQLNICRYRLIMDARNSIAAIAGQYARLLQTPSRNRNQKLNSMASSLDSLIRRTVQLKNLFKQAWLYENQYYSLDIVEESFDSKIRELSSLLASIREQAKRNSKGLPLLSKEQIGLNIETTSYSYLPYWLISGAFPVKNYGELPAFTYSEGSEYNQPPSPGAITLYRNSPYRWHKRASSNGGQINLQALFKVDQPSAAFAYCLLKVTGNDIQDLFIRSTAGTEFYCNGEKLTTVTPHADTSVAQRIPVTLKSGKTYHLLLKVPQTSRSAPWLFDIRTGEGVDLINNKHKYQTNTKKKTYEAE